MLVESSSFTNECVSLISIANNDGRALAHEIGHFLHSSLTPHKYHYFTNNFPVDFAEFIAVFLESIHSYTYY